MDENIPLLCVDVIEYACLILMLVWLISVNKRGSSRQGTLTVKVVDVKFILSQYFTIDVPISYIYTSCPIRAINAIANENRYDLTQCLSI